MLHLYRIFHIIIALALYGCQRDGAFVLTPDSEEDRVEEGSLSLILRSTSDAMSIDDDDSFSSVAIFIFDDDDEKEMSLLMPYFSLVESKSISIAALSGLKSIYVVANYSGKSFESGDGESIELSEDLTLSQLESLYVVESGEIVPNSLLMVGRYDLTIEEGDNGGVAEILLRRLEARVDLHIYKGGNLEGYDVTLNSVALHNQVLSSEVIFDYGDDEPQMMDPTIYGVSTKLSGAELLSYSSDGEEIDPTQAEATFYSYQSIIDTNLSDAPYLEVEIEYGGNRESYTAYIVDEDQTEGRYSLLQNNLYQVVAILDADQLTLLDLDRIPWSVTTIQYNEPISDLAFTFGAHDGSWGGAAAKTIRSNEGVVEQAIFDFEITTPIGVEWVATLTNGVDFEFDSSSGGLRRGVGGVSSQIVVSATKAWRGSLRHTEFYIMVEGEELEINSEGGYDGSATRIVVKQVESKE